MTMEIIVPLFIFFMANLASSDYQLFDVLDYGAFGDGVIDDSEAFGQAWEDFCGSTTNRTILRIPEGKTYLLEPLKFKGPCRPTYLQVQIDGNLTAPTKPWNDTDVSSWIEFLDVEGLVVNASAHINGRGFAWWNNCPVLGHCKRPTALKFHNCSNLQVWGLKSLNSPKNHISLSASNNVKVSNVHLYAPKTSPNTDGIDISESTNIQIQQSVIGTGDDCIAINNGSSNINITWIKCGPGHGISIGSLGSKESYATVTDVHVSNCTFVGTQNGARIKTWQGGAGYARNIKFEDILLQSVNRSIIIDQYYCPHKSCEVERSAVNISGVWFKRFYGTSLDKSTITLSCSRTIACTNINLEQINITTVVPYEEPYAHCINVHGTSNNTIPPVNCLLP